MTKEYWDFLLSMRSASTDPSVTEAIIFGMLVILEITDARHAAEHFPKHVVETQAWAAGRSLSRDGLIVDMFQRMDDGTGTTRAGGILLVRRGMARKHERIFFATVNDS